MTRRHDMYWVCYNGGKLRPRLLISGNKKNMAATAVGFDSLETEVQAHMATHPQDDIFQVRSAFAMKAMLNEAPAAVIKPTQNGGKFLDLPLLRGAIALFNKTSS